MAHARLPSPCTGKPLSVCLGELRPNAVLAKRNQRIATAGQTVSRRGQLSAEGFGESDSVAHEETCVASRHSERRDFGRNDRRRSRAAKPFGELTDLELVHLVLQGAEWDTEVFGCGGHVPPALLQRAQHEVAFEGVGRLFEQALE